MLDRHWRIAQAIVAAVLVVTALPHNQSAAAEPSSPAEPQAEFEERSRKAELLASDRWRRAVFELDEWLAVQPVYTSGQVVGMKADLARRIKAMSSYELDYLLDNLEFKLRVLDTPEATEGYPGQWHFGNGLPADERLVSLGRSGPGRPEPVSRNAPHPLRWRFSRVGAGRFPVGRSRGFDASRLAPVRGCGCRSRAVLGATP